MRRWILWVPLAVFALLLGVALHGLYRPNDPTVRSALIGEPLPQFALDPIVPGKPGLSKDAFRAGEPRLLNIFASWCVPCVAEAPQLMQLKAAGATIDAIAIRDTAPAVRRFLSRHGNPYARIGSDPQSAVQLALGSSGVPETFVIDGKGHIVAQHVGDIRADDVPKLLAALEAAR